MTDEYPSIKTSDVGPGPLMGLYGRGGVEADITGYTKLTMLVRGEAPLPVPADHVESTSPAQVRIVRGDLAPPQGSDDAWFDYEFEVVYAGGSPADRQTFPERGYARLNVWDDLGDG